MENGVLDEIEETPVFGRIVGSFVGR